jgi:hypothetical protein
VVGRMEKQIEGSCGVSCVKVGVGERTLDLNHDGMVRVTCTSGSPLVFGEQ